MENNVKQIIIIRIQTFLFQKNLHLFFGGIMSDTFDRIKQIGNVDESRLRVVFEKRENLVNFVHPFCRNRLRSFFN